MALKQGKESFTKWTHVENGKVMVRRIHRIEIQARNGSLYTIRGDQLPDFIQTSAGRVIQAHLAANPVKSQDHSTTQAVRRASCQFLADVS